MGRYKVKFGRKYGWNINGYFEVENEVALRKIVNEINQWNIDNEIDEKFTLISFEEVIKGKWKKNKAIKNFDDWLKKKIKLENFEQEKNRMVNFISAGLSICIGNVLLIMFREQFVKFLQTEISFFNLAYLILFSIAAFLILLALKNINNEPGNNLFFLVTFIFIPVLIIYTLPMGNFSIQSKLIFLYVYIVGGLNIGIVSTIRLIGMGYKVFQKKISEENKRIEIIIAIFATVISLIALLK